MNASKLIFLVALLLLPPIAVARTDEQVQRNLEIVETWRSTPLVIIRRCSLVDPDGAYPRESKVIAWQIAHSEIIKKIDANFKKIIPPLLNGKNIYLDLVGPMREKINADILKRNFSDKTDEQVKDFCKGYQIDASSLNMERVEIALKELEIWREDNHVSLPD